jgi:tetratricopeptide (TPR) repeat protein
MRGYHRSKFNLVSILILLVALCSSAAGQEHTVNYWLQVGNEFSSKGSYELAENCYDKAIEIDSRNVSAWSQNGLALAHLNKYNESLRAFDVAVKLDPKRVDVWISKGSALYILAKYDEALDNKNETSEHFEPKNNYTLINNLNGSVEHKKFGNTHLTFQKE